MRWVLLSPFTRAVEPGWIFPFIDPAKHTVKAVPATYDHDRSRKNASASDWLDFLKHAARGFFQSLSGQDGRGGRGEHVGIITVFPQLALIAALLKKLSGRKNLPLIAWCFNLAQPYDGMKGRVARFCLSSVDIFVVHSRAEIAIYSAWLNLPSSRFVFVPLSAEWPVTEAWQERSDEPYIIALGTANRDYALLTAAVAKLGYKTKIVAGPHATAGLEIPACVELQSGLSLAQCHALATHARMHVIPVANASSPSGQVTVIESMMLGVPLIATRCAGTVDYINDSANALLVNPGDLEGLTQAIQNLWQDAGLRMALSTTAKASALEKLTFRAVSADMARIMDQLATR